ncbi:MAG: glycosyltransferase family 2 protein [Dehalococcoidia bacterium]
MAPSRYPLPDMTAPDLFVVILNYNTAEHVRRCLAALPAGCAGLTYETIVVDNASPQSGIEAAVAAFPSVRLIKRRQNGGFSAGINAGLRAARSNAILILNPDSTLAPGAAVAMFDFLRSNSDVGVLGPRILNEDGTLQLSCRRFPTFAAAAFNRNSLLTRLLPRNRYSATYLMSDWDHSAVSDVDWLSGAAMMLNRTALDQVGMFDERYFFEIEDVDLCRRMHDAGFRVVYFPHAEVTHRIGASSRTLPNRVIVARHQGMWLYYRRYMRGGPALDALTGTAILGRCLLFLARANGQRAIAETRRRLPARRRDRALV